MSKDPKFYLVLIVVLVFGFLYAEIEEKRKEEIKKYKEENSKKPVFKLDEDSVKLRAEGDFNVYYFDVGQADSILIECNDEYMLIDAGNNNDGDGLVNYLKRLGVSKLKYVIGTHAHEDHIGGMDNILYNFDVEHFYMPDVVTTTKTFEDVIIALEDKQIAFETPKVGSFFFLGTSKFTVLHVGDESDDLNDTSIVVRGLFGNNSFLFMGDATSKVEERILDMKIDSDVLKVGHHGSSYSSSDKFLKEVTPEFAIISSGDGNSYGHPHDEALNRLKNNNVKLYRTDREGTIVATSDGEIISFRSVETNING